MSMIDSTRRYFNTHTKGSPVLFSICILAIMIVGWGNDYASCTRNNGLRAPLRIQYASAANRAQQRAAVEIGVRRRLDLQAAVADWASLRRVQPLNCATLFPQQ